MAVLALCFCWMGFSLVAASTGYSLVAVCRLLIAVSSLAVEHRLQGMRAKELWHVGSVVPRHVGSFWIRDWTRVPCIGRQILYHWATGEPPCPDSCLCLYEQTVLPSVASTPWNSTSIPSCSLSLWCGLWTWPCLAFHKRVLVCSGETLSLSDCGVCFGGSLSPVLSWFLAIPSVVISTATHSRDRGGKGQPMDCVSTGQLLSKELRRKQGGTFVMAYHQHDSYIDFYFSYKYWA